MRLLARNRLRIADHHTHGLSPVQASSHVCEISNQGLARSGLDCAESVSGLRRFRGAGREACEPFGR